MPKAYTVKDANGKDFEFDVQDIMDMVTSPQIPLGDGEVLKDNPLRIIDHLGNPLTIGQITDSANNSDPIVALDVTFEATHSGRNLNYAEYQSDSMEKDAATFLVPFRKPLIKNHDMYEEPLGRAVDVQFGRSILNEDKDTIAVKFRVTDKEAVPKFLDGRYGTLSIGASANHVKCQICGQDIVKDGQFKKFCGHWRGETYNGVACYWTSRDLVYKEGSVVNAPADHWAQVIEIKAYTQSQLDALSDNAQKETVSNATEEDAAKDTGVNIADSEDPAAIIDSLLTEDGEKAAAEGEGDTSTEENEDGEGSGEGEDGGAEEGSATGEEGDGEGQNELTEVRSQLDAANARIAELEADLAKANTDLNDATAKIVDLEAAKKTSDEQATLFKNQAVKLAIKVKDDLIETIVTKMVDSKEITDEQADETKTALKSKTTKELEDKLNSLAPKATTEVPPATNPGFVNNDDDHVIDGDKDEPKDSKQTEREAKAKRTKDAEDKLAKKFGFN